MTSSGSCARLPKKGHSIRQGLSVSAEFAGTVQKRYGCPVAECWNLDLFLQEIVLHRGLYYYLCGVPNRREVAKYVVAPIFEKLRGSRFSVTYPVQIHRHLLTGAPHWSARPPRTSRNPRVRTFVSETEPQGNVGGNLHCTRRSFNRMERSA